jgi:FkbM family methyltransferase
MHLAYDLGGFNGDDTAHYLGLGYRVVCIEASPNLAGKLLKRFAEPIRRGLCTVVNVAVGEHRGNLPFYICDGIEERNSFDRTCIERAGLKAREISVSVRPFASIIC